MTLTDISNARLSSQHLTSSKFKTVKELVAWMGAMQAQDYSMVKWAIGSRLPGTAEKIIDEAIKKGEIIRAHLMRPTWHIVSADDIYWMLELTAPQIRSATRSRHKDLELTQSILNKTNRIIEKALEGGNHLTRNELNSLFEKAKITLDNNRSAHIMLSAELDGIVCSGATKDNKPSYALLSERVKKTKSYTREEALRKLALKYFSSHGPATLHDFIWWSGLPVKEARMALELVKSEFISEKIENETYWLNNSFSMSNIKKKHAFLLPAYDEFIISYKNRTASLPFQDQCKAVSNNGIFRPVVVVNGQVIGIWKRTIKNEKVLIETNFFGANNKSVKQLIDKEALKFGSFLEKTVEVK
ncbi:MAG: winged helix DNA-binding domain-containing protein [Bacteroidales bacterium]|nr:winged helix DNA-binding domain-containing protein [Bacteroidales bacterium]